MESLERGDELAGPGVGEAVEALACGGDDVAGGVEQAVAEPFRLSIRKAVVEKQGAGPGEQIVRDQAALDPGLVDAE